MKFRNLLTYIKELIFKLVSKPNNMANQQDLKKQIQEKAKKIEILYREYLAKLNEFKQKQLAFINEFLKKLEKRKIEEIKKKLENSNYDQ